METFDLAYHQLMIELMNVQVKLIRESIGESPNYELYIDGGYMYNEIFVKLISYH